MYVAPNGTHFQKEPDGIMREMVDELLSEREEKKGAPERPRPRHRALRASTTDSRELSRLL